MFITQNSFMQLLIAKNIARTGTTALDPAASTYIIDGEVVVTDVSGTILDSTTVVNKDKVVIVQSQGASLPTVQSPAIERTGVKTYSGKAYTALVNQIDYVGYNAVTGAGDIDVINDNGYEILIHDLNSYNWGSIGVDKFGFCVSDSAATKAEINDGLALNLYQNIARVVRVPFTVERVSSATFIASTGTTGTATVTAGSTAITISGAGGEIVAGSYIRIGTTATTTLTLGVYKVTAASGTSITIDIPYQGTSGTFATTAFAVATLTATAAANAAVVNAGALGIKLVGKSPVFVSPQSTEPYVNRWITTVRNGGSTEVVNQVGASEGVGTYIKMASLEYFLIGNEGFISRNDSPYVTPRANIVASANYSMIDLEWDSVKSGQIFNQQAASKQLIIAFQEGGNREQLTGVVTSVQTVLNAWIGTTPGPFVDLTLS